MRVVVIVQFHDGPRNKTITPEGRVGASSWPCWESCAALHTVEFRQELLFLEGTRTQDAPTADEAAEAAADAAPAAAAAAAAADARLCAKRVC